MDSPLQLWFFVTLPVFGLWPDLIFVIFSPQMYFWAQFFSTWKRINFGKKCINFAYMATFSTSHTCHMWRISDFSTSVMWRHLKFVHMWRNFQFPPNYHTWKAEISPHDNLSPLIILVILVTNMRSGQGKFVQKLEITSLVLPKFIPDLRRPVDSFDWKLPNLTQLSSAILITWKTKVKSETMFNSWRVISSRWQVYVFVKNCSFHISGKVENL